MKKAFILLTALLITTTAFSQQQRGDRNNKKERREDFKSFYSGLTPDQIAELKTKRMVLALDLTDAQQKEILSLNKELAEKHNAQLEAFKANKEKGVKPTPDEKYAMMNARLDEQIDVQQKMKHILTEDQYRLWKKNKHKTRAHFMRKAR